MATSGRAFSHKLTALRVRDAQGRGRATRPRRPRGRPSRAPRARRWRRRVARFAFPSAGWRKNNRARLGESPRRAWPDAPGAQALLLLRIGNISGFDQHRGNVGRFQYHEAGLLHLAACEPRRRASVRAAHARPPSGSRSTTPIATDRAARKPAHRPCRPSETPPIRSEAFSRSASQRAASSVAPCCDRMYTEEPSTLRSRIESACIETNRSACMRAGAAHPIAQRHEVIAAAREHRPSFRSRH